MIFFNGMPGFWRTVLAWLKASIRPGSVTVRRMVFRRGTAAVTARRCLRGSRGGAGATWPHPRIAAQCDDQQQDTGSGRDERRPVIRLPPGIAGLAEPAHSRRSRDRPDRARPTAPPHRRCTTANTEGRTNKVANVAAASPPITARPSGGLRSLPSPKASRQGVMPAIIARLVIRIGRTRLLAPFKATIAVAPSRRRCSANVTSRMPLAMATPTDMISPIND